MDKMEGGHNWTDSLTTPVLIILLCTILILYFLLGRRKTNIPGPPALPILGNILQLMKVPKGKIHLYNRELAKKYGEIMCFRAGPRLVVWLNTYKLIHEAFTKQADIFSNRPKHQFMKKNMGIVWGNGLEWKRIRRFSLQSLKDFGVGKHTVEERILEEVSNVLKLLEESKGEPVNVKQMMTKAVCNTIHSVVFGFRYEYSSEKFDQLLEDLDAIFSTPTSPLVLFLPFLRRFLPTKKGKLQTCFKRTSDYITQQIEEHKSTFDENNLRDFIDIYIKSDKDNGLSNNITAEWLFEAIRNFFNAGTDTTATSLQWAFLFMLKYPEIQKKCQEQIEKHVGSGRMVTLADRNKLTYIDATINEIQRLGNIAIGSVPHINTEDANLCGYYIPKGSTVIANIYHIHTSRENWSDPEQFQPERFLSPEGQLLKGENFIPFGSGARKCPGDTLARTEIFLMLSNALQRFTFNLEDNNTELSLEGTQGVTLSPQPYKLRACLR